MTTSAATPPLNSIIQQQQHQQQQQQQHSIQMLHHSATSSGLPHGLGLLTTVASLPPKYRSRYLSINIKSETPLDLSVKPFSPQIANDVPIATSFTEVYTEPSNEIEIQQSQQQHQHQHHQIAEEVYTTLTNAPYELMDTIEVAHTVVVTTEPILSQNTLQQEQEHHRLLPTTHINDHLVTDKSSPITPPPTPTTKRKFNEHLLNHDGDGDCDDDVSCNNNSITIPSEIKIERITMTATTTDNYLNPTKIAKTIDNPTIKPECTPIKPIRPTDSAPKTIKAQPLISKTSKNKATRKLKFDKETSSPVSGTIIRPLEDITDGTIQYSNGDIDPKYNIVEITEETKAELAAIKNVIGDYICKLCRLKFDDAFGLAQHRCACIVLLEYRCPECGKQFNCPANLASHRRWHKPKKDGGGGGGVSANGGGGGAKKENRNTTNASTIQQRSTIFTGELQTTTGKHNENTNVTSFACGECGKKFKRQAYLRKHQLTHTVEGKKAIGKNPLQQKKPITTTTTTTVQTNVKNLNIQSYQSYNGSSSSGASLSSSSSSSLHSYSGASVTHDDDDVNGAVYVVNNVGHADVDGDGNYNSIYNYDDDDDGDSMSDRSNSSTGYGRLQIVESGLTEEENIAATALTNLRNCASVIQHTTLAH